MKNQACYDFRIPLSSLKKQKFQKSKVSMKWFSDKANEKDIEMLDRLINKRAAEG